MLPVPVRKKLHISACMIVFFVFFLEALQKMKYILNEFEFFYVKLSLDQCKFSASLHQTCTTVVQV